MRKSGCFRGRLGWPAVAVAMALAGCASAPKAVAPRLYGVWVNTATGPHNWVEIEAHHVVSFAVTQSNGRCASTEVDILAKDRLSVPVSALGSGEMSLRLDGRTLVVAGKYATQHYQPATRESICQGPGGTYFPGAPYPK
jgi:hypothetical protein